MRKKQNDKRDVRKSNMALNCQLSIICLIFKCDWVND